MNGEQFKVLELEQQVEYINELLTAGDTVDNIRIALGVGKNYIGNTFKKGGYIKDRATGLYILNTGNTINTNNSNISNTNNTNKAIQKVQEQSKKANNIKVLENRIESLEKELEQLKAIVLSNTTNTIEITDISNTSNTKKVKQYNSKDLVSRNYKIDKEVADNFVKFCKNNKLKYDYKVSDLITNAIVEYMKNFNK